MGGSVNIGRGPGLCILGGAPECWNLGVAALGTSAVGCISRAFRDSRCRVQTYSQTDNVRLRLGGRDVELEAIQIWNDPRLRSRSGLRHMTLVGQLSPRVRRWATVGNRNLQRVLDSSVFLDVSGGDSFAEIYGQDSFEYQVKTKRLARDLDKTLVLLPQTYGPFGSQEARLHVREIIDYAAVVATRDWDGLEAAARELGDRTAEKMVRCPDMAFTLEPVPVEAFRERGLLAGRQGLVVGLNVSGLLTYGKSRFGIEHSHQDLCRALAEWAIERCHSRLVLVPHVISELSPEETLRRGATNTETSDTFACLALCRELERKYGDRVITTGWPYGPGETKYLIGQCDFFIGARMHACIAGVSQFVPTVTLAYSKKAAGVMAHAGVEDCVLDLRTRSVEQCLRDVAVLFSRRCEINSRLKETIPDVQGQVRCFFETALANALEMAGVTGDHAGRPEEVQLARHQP